MGGDDAADTIGTTADAGLLAREIERARHDAPALGHADDEACANCGTVRQGPYCHACGQAGHVHHTLGALVHDIAHGVFHFEGKLAATLPLLALRPGELTRRYVAGERARFVSPIALFLFSVFLMFAVVSDLAGHGTRHVHVLSEADLQAQRGKLAALQAERTHVTDAGARARLDGHIREQRRSVEVLEQLNRARGGVGVTGKHEVAAAAAPDFRTGWDWLDHAVAHAAANPDLLFYKLKSYGYKYSWALIPISLPFIWLLFAFRRDVGLYDHAIFATYSLAFMSLGVVTLVLVGLLDPPSVLITLAVLIVPPWHMYRQLKGAYRLTRIGALWRTVALLLITGVAAVLFAALLFYLGSE